jgi:PAS domain S-box-containing protein
VVSTNLAFHVGTGRPVRAQGIVLFQARPDRLYCLDGAGPLRVRLRTEDIHPAGERLEIIGTVTAADGRPWISQATVRRLGKDALPLPVEATLEQAHSNRLDAIRLSIRGVVLGHQFAPAIGFGRETVVVDDAAGEGRGFFQVRLPKGTGIRTRFPTGSSIRAVGLSIVETGTPDTHVVSIYPASIGDVEVLGRPFWSEPWARIAASIVGVVLLIGAAWALSQRRQFRLVQNSEERLRALSEHSFDATCVLDRDGSVKFMTQAARRFIGASKPEEAPTREGFFQSMHPDDVPRIMEILETVLSAPGASRRISGYRIRMPDRSVRWVESIVSNCLDVPGVEGVVVNLHDITEQTEAFQGLARAADLQRHLNDFATSLSPLTEEREVLGDVIRKCISHLGFAECVIYLTDPERGMLVQAAALGPKDHGDGGVLNPIELPIGRGIVGAAAESGQTIIVEDTRNDPRYIVDDAVRLSEIAVPILSEGKVLGVIDSEHPRAGFFNQDHASILGSIAFLCANKIVRARTDRTLQQLNRELERRIGERTSELQGTNERLTLEIAERTRAESVQRALFGISEAVHSAEDLAHLYARIHAIIGTLMPATNFYIALLDPVTGMVSFPYHRDETDAPLEPRNDRRGMTEYVLRTGRPTLAGLDEIQRLKDEGEYEQTGHPAAIWLGVPLQYQGRTFGVMAVQDHHDPEAFDAEDKRLLNFVAGQTALAIERKRSEEQLREHTRRLHESEERFRRTFSALPSNVSLVRLSDQTFVEVNEAVITSTGFSREEFLGKTTGDLRLWVVEAERAEFFRRLAQDGRVRAMEAAMRAKSGRIDIVLISAERLEVEGEPHILTLSINISERKQAEEELLRSLARERELSRLKSEFVSLVSHEFRTPIGIIHSSAEILERYLDQIPGSERREHLRAIQSHSWRMASLMEAVLVFGRAEAGKLEFQAMDFDLGPSLQRWVDEFLRASQGASAVQVTVPDIPRKAHGDPDLLRHIVTNLLSNAVKFSPAGACVTVAVRRDGAHAVLRVEDHGAGIPESDRELLFTAFHRGSNVRHVPGTGLGLAVIRRCLDLHHGTIRIDSTEGAGTSVTVQIPLFTEEPSP